jgi:hypothetical protein
MSHVAGVNVNVTMESKTPGQNQPVAQPASAPTPKAEPKPEAKAVPFEDPVVATVKAQTPTQSVKKEDKTMSKHAGLDIGTMNIISSIPKGNTVETKRIRNVFMDLTLDQVKMLKLSGNTSYITKGDTCYV